jgi:hypothetical protein
MASRVVALLVVSLLAGCTTDAVVRGFVLPDCAHGPVSSPTAHAARCMTGAMYEIVQERREASSEESRDSQEDTDVSAPSE